MCSSAQGPMNAIRKVQLLIAVCAWPLALVAVFKSHKSPEAILQIVVVRIVPPRRFVALILGHSELIDLSLRSPYLAPLPSAFSPQDESPENHLPLTSPSKSLSIPRWALF